MKTVSGEFPGKRLRNRRKRSQRREVIVPAKFAEDEERILQAFRARSSRVEVCVEEREFESGGDEVNDETTVGDPTRGFSEEGLSVREVFRGVIATASGPGEAD
nr:hypothetical protein Iba_chr11dCG3920 [Ipomoea batatas]